MKEYYVEYSECEVCEAWTKHISIIENIDQCPTCSTILEIPEWSVYTSCTPCQAKTKKLIGWLLCREGSEHVILDGEKISKLEVLISLGRDPIAYYKKMMTKMLKRK